MSDQALNSVLHRSLAAGLLLALLIGAGSPSASSAQVAASPTEICPLLIGESVPPLVLEDFEGKRFDLRAAVESRPTVLIFYRGGWCPYCTDHLSELKDIDEELDALGYQIIALSPDRPLKVNLFRVQNRLPFIMLSDSEMKAARAFGLAFEVDDETLEQYGEWGIDLVDHSGRDHHMLPVPAAYVLRTDGSVAYFHAEPDYKGRVPAELLLAAARIAIED